jgi:hypothetical protein
MDLNASLLNQLSPRLRGGVLELFSRFLAAALPAAESQEAAETKAAAFCNEALGEFEFTPADYLAAIARREEALSSILPGEVREVVAALTRIEDASAEEVIENALRTHALACIAKHAPIDPPKPRGCASRGLRASAAAVLRKEMRAARASVSRARAYAASIHTRQNSAAHQNLKRALDESAAAGRALSRQVREMMDAGHIDFDVIAEGIRNLPSPDFPALMRAFIDSESK